MPSRNTRKPKQLGTFHVYNRGRNDRPIFIDDEDRDKFADLLKHHLGDRIALHAICLMTTHFHLLIWQKQLGALEHLMAEVLRVYVRYFNARHGTKGPLFAGPYRARPIESSKDFMWCVGYIHDNHPSGLDYRHSTHRYFLDAADAPGWLDVESALSVFGGLPAYLEYLGKRELRAELDRELRLEQ